jgi:uncharacterized protein (DUF1697 family)
VGREAQVRCDIGTQTETVKAQIESGKLILRGSAIRRQLETDRISRARVHDDALVFEAPEGDTVMLHLGAKEASTWLRKLQAPAPTLTDKLGIGRERLVAVYGTVDDEKLAEALHEVVATTAEAATVLVAVLRSKADLDEVVQLHAAMPCRGLWVVHEKGPKASLKSVTIRETLRGLGYKDHKVAGISPQWTATRYAKPAA